MAQGFQISFDHLQHTALNQGIPKIFLIPVSETVRMPDIHSIYIEGMDSSEYVPAPAYRDIWNMVVLPDKAPF